MVNFGNITYEKRVNVIDGQFLSRKYFNITILEINNLPKFTNIGVQTIYSRGEGSNFNYQLLGSKRSKTFCGQYR